MRILLPHHLLSPRGLGIACVTYAVLVWAGWMIVTSYSVRGSLSTYDLTALRFGVSGLVLLPVLWRRGLSIGPYGRWGSLILAALMGIPFNLITIYAMGYVPASHAGLLNISMLTVTSVVGITLLREKTTRWRLAGIGLSIAGIVAILVARPLPVGSNALMGHIFLIAGGCLWAAYVLTVRIWRADAMHATAVVCCLSGLTYVPMYLMILPIGIGLHNLNEVLVQGLYQGIINSVFAMFCFNRAVALLGASTASAFLPLVPALATLFAIPALGEIPQPIEVFGIGIATVGVLLATGILKRRAQP